MFFARWLRLHLPIDVPATVMELDGYFNATGEPAIQLDLGLGKVEILIDTGFAGWLIVRRLALRLISRMPLKASRVFLLPPVKLLRPWFILLRSIGSTSESKCP